MGCARCASVCGRACCNRNFPPAAPLAPCPAPRMPALRCLCARWRGRGGELEQNETPNHRLAAASLSGAAAARSRPLGWSTLNLMGATPTCQKCFCWAATSCRGQVGAGAEGCATVLAPPLLVHSVYTPPSPPATRSVPLQWALSFVGPAGSRQEAARRLPSLAPPACLGLAERARAAPMPANPHLAPWLAHPPWLQGACFSGWAESRGSAAQHGCPRARAVAGACHVSVCVPPKAGGQPLPKGWHAAS